MSPPDIKQPVFACDGYRYEIYETQVQHVDFDTLYLAWRHTVATGARSPVVMKPFLVSVDGTSRERGWEEVQVATYLTHPNITKVHGIANTPGQASEREFYVVMESMPGLYLMTALDVALLLGRRFSPAFCAYIAAMVATALDYAHRRKDNQGHELHIIHRAVSPMSVRLGFDGRVKLGNFGAAYSQLRDRLPTPPGLLRGDAAYTAPEVWRALLASPGLRFDSVGLGRVDGRADVFSLGFGLLEMLLGEYPLDPTDGAARDRRSAPTAMIKTARPTWIDPGILAERTLRFDADAVVHRSEDVPKGLRNILRRALCPDPSERIDAGTMRDELLGFLKSLERPFGEVEMARELKDVFEAGKLASRLLANPIERTALSIREA